MGLWHKTTLATELASSEFSSEPLWRSLKSPALALCATLRLQRIRTVTSEKKLRKFLITPELELDVCLTRATALGRLSKPTKKWHFITVKCAWGLEFKLTEKSVSPWPRVSCKSLYFNHIDFFYSINFEYTKVLFCFIAVWDWAEESADE